MNSEWAYGAVSWFSLSAGKHTVSRRLHVHVHATQKTHHHIDTSWADPVGKSHSAIGKASQFMSLTHTTKVHGSDEGSKHQAEIPNATSKRVMCPNYTMGSEDCLFRRRQMTTCKTETNSLRFKKINSNINKINK